MGHGTHRETGRQTKGAEVGSGGDSSGGGGWLEGAKFTRLQFKYCNCRCQSCWVTKQLRQWWCHWHCLACRAAAASFLSRSTFLPTVVKEMSSEQKPIWQLRVKWGGKSKSHPSFGLGLRRPSWRRHSPTACGILWNKILLLSTHKHPLTCRCAWKKPDNIVGLVTVLKMLFKMAAGGRTAELRHSLLLRLSCYFNLNR